MDIEFKCTKCGQNLVIDEAGARLPVDCPECGWIVLVPPTKTNQIKQPVALTSISSSSMKNCPFCAEVIKVEAVVCRFCSRELLPSPTAIVVCPFCAEVIDSGVVVCPFCHRDSHTPSPRTYKRPMMALILLGVLAVIVLVVYVASLAIDQKVERQIKMFKEQSQ